MKTPEIFTTALIVAALAEAPISTPNPILPEGYSWAECTNLGGLKVPKPDGFIVQTFSGLNQQTCIISEQPLESVDDPVQTGLVIKSYKALSDPSLSIAQPTRPQYPSTFLNTRQTFVQERLLINRQSFKVYANQRDEKSYDDSRLTMINAANSTRRTVYRATFEIPITEYQADPKIEEVMTDVNNLKFNPNY